MFQCSDGVLCYSVVMECCVLQCSDGVLCYSVTV